MKKTSQTDERVKLLNIYKNLIPSLKKDLVSTAEVMMNTQEIVLETVNAGKQKKVNDVKKETANE